MGYTWSHVQMESKPSESARFSASRNPDQSLYWFQQLAPSFSGASDEGIEHSSRAVGSGSLPTLADPHARAPHAKIANHRHASGTFVPIGGRSITWPRNSAVAASRA